MPERRLVNKMKNTATITAIVAKQIYPIKQRQGNDKPAITYEVISDQSVNHSTGGTATSSCRVQVDCWAVTYPVARALANALKAALLSWSDATGDPLISSCHYMNGSDIVEPPNAGQDTVTYRVSQDYLIWYNPA